VWKATRTGNFPHSPLLPPLPTALRRVTKSDSTDRLSVGREVCVFFYFFVFVYKYWYRIRKIYSLRYQPGDFVIRQRERAERFVLQHHSLPLSRARKHPSTPAADTTLGEQPHCRAVPERYRLAHGSRSPTLEIAGFTCFEVWNIITIKHLNGHAPSHPC
jgi:hypothetical protein